MSCSRRTSRPETSTCSCSEERRPCSRVSDAVRSARSRSTSGLDSPAAAIASAGDLGSSVSFASLARRPEPNPPSWSATARSLELEDLGQVQERRPEDDDEHRREDEQHSREEHLDRRLHRLLLGEQLPLQARVTGL